MLQRSFCIAASVMALAMVISTASAAQYQPVVVPAAFAAKVSGACERLAAALHRAAKTPPAVLKAERAMPNNATSQQFQLFADYSMVHWMPLFERSLLRLTALGQPAEGAQAWNRFLSDWRDYVVSNVAYVARMQRGLPAAAAMKGSKAVGEAIARLAASADPAGAGRCYKVVK